MAIELRYKIVMHFTTSHAFPCDRQCVLVVIALELAEESRKPVEEKL